MVGAMSRRSRLRSAPLAHALGVKSGCKNNLDARVEKPAWSRSLWQGHRTRV